MVASVHPRPHYTGSPRLAKAGFAAARLALPAVAR